MIKDITTLLSIIPIGLTIAYLVNYIPNKLKNSWWKQAVEILNHEEDYKEKENSHLSKKTILVHTLLIAVAILIYKINNTPKDEIHLIAFMILSSLLIIASSIDLNHKIIPDSISFSLMSLGMIINQDGLICSLKSSVFGIITGYLFLLSIAFIFKKITTQEGIGYGDCKILAALGAWTGWEMLPQILWLSALLGCAHWLILKFILKKHQERIYIPYGPSLSIAGWILILTSGSM